MCWQRRSTTTTTLCSSYDDYPCRSTTLTRYENKKSQINSLKHHMAKIEEKKKRLESQVADIKAELSLDKQEIEKLETECRIMMERRVDHLGFTRDYDRIMALDRILVLD
jgi:peptidoglycan hydrolase CwlO-like protein